MIVVVILSLLSCLQGLVCYWMGYDRGLGKARESEERQKRVQLVVHSAPEQMELTETESSRKQPDEKIKDDYIIPIEEPVPSSYDSSIMSHDPGHSISGQ